MIKHWNGDMYRLMKMLEHVALNEYLDNLWRLRVFFLGRHVTCTDMWVGVHVGSCPCRPVQAVPLGDRSRPRPKQEDGQVWPSLILRPTTEANRTRLDTTQQHLDWGCHPHPQKAHVGSMYGWTMMVLKEWAVLLQKCFKMGQAIKDICDDPLELRVINQ